MLPIPLSTGFGVIKKGSANSTSGGTTNEKNASTAVDITPPENRLPKFL